MLRYRLWEVELYVNRTLVYGGLTGLVTAVYILLVGTVGTLAANQNGRWGAFALTLIVAVVGIRPLHHWLDNKANQLIPIQKLITPPQ